MALELKDMVAAQSTALTRVEPKIDTAAVAAAETAKALVQAAYLVAVNRPRCEDDARARLLKACRVPRFAETVQFKRPQGGKIVKGFSIRFAEAAVRCWGNIRTDCHVTYEDERVRRVHVFVTDLESNTSFGQEMAIQKTVERRSAEGREVLSERTNSQGDTVYVVVATEDEMQAKENAALSKIIRNDGLRLIPADVKEEALEAALKTIADKDAKDPNAAKKGLLDAFSEIGVRPLDVVAYLGHSIDNLCKAELEDLRGIYAAIRDGETSWAAIMRERSEPKTEEPGLKPQQSVEPKKEQAPQTPPPPAEEQPKPKPKGKPKGSTPATPPAQSSEKQQGGLNLAPPQEPPKENLSIVDQRKKAVREFMDFAIATEKDVIDLMRGFGYETDKWDACDDVQILTDVVSVLGDRMRQE